MSVEDATTSFKRPRSGSPRKKLLNKIFFPLFPLNRHNSAPIGSIRTKKYGRRGRDEPFPMTAVWFS
ncbi:hypothetical protein V1477_006327 [Vespula maculifrons]|uniref:Uncharacterized protein n=1 Tax=Vespula maculifrons TaxID=7453 RepID=A0ABD2CK62_VESMC